MTGCELGTADYRLRGSWCSGRGARSECDLHTRLMSRLDEQMKGIRGIRRSEGRRDRVRIFEECHSHFSSADFHAQSWRGRRTPTGG